MQLTDEQVQQFEYDMSLSQPQQPVRKNRYAVVHLNLVQDGETFNYSLVFSAYFVKFLKKDVYDKTTETYYVNRLDGKCSCLGYTKHKHCKHSDWVKSIYALR